MIKITFKNLIIFLFLPILFYSCSEESIDCSICGDRAKCFYVTVTDSIGRPLNSLTVSVTDNCGNILYTPQNPISAALGQYTLIDGEYVDLYQNINTCGVDIKFSATDGTRTLEKTFTFRIFEGTCYCEYPLINLVDYSGQPILIMK